MMLDFNISLPLNDGHSIPQLGLGVWMIRNGKDCQKAVLSASEAGYRHIDTASFYGNEESVGAAVRASGIPREQIYITTKLWNSDHGNPARALEDSLRKLKMDYVDLYLIHYPVAERRHSWQALEFFKAQGKTHSIGVSNFTIRHLIEFEKQSETVPAVNQVEFHPYLFQRDLLGYCRGKGIVIQAYSPLTHGERLKDPKLVKLIKNYPGKSPAQILIRWALQHEIVVLPKSANAQRIAENADVFNFEISAGDMERLNGFNEDLRTCWDPTDAP